MPRLGLQRNRVAGGTGLDSEFRFAPKTVETSIGKLEVRQTTEPRQPRAGVAGAAPAQLKQLVSCSKCGADQNNWVLSWRNWTRAKKRSVKSARSIWSMVCRLNPMMDKNRIAATIQVNDSCVRHFSRATDFSNAFQNVRWFRRRKLRKDSPGGDGIFVPIFAGLKFKANTLGASD